MHNLGVVGVYTVCKGMRSTQVTRDGEEKTLKVSGVGRCDVSRSGDERDQQESHEGHVDSWERGACCPPPAWWKGRRGSVRCSKMLLMG